MNLWAILKRACGLDTEGGRATAPRRVGANRRRPGIDPLEGRRLLSASVNDFPLPKTNFEPVGLAPAANGSMWLTEIPNTFGLDLSGPPPLQSLAKVAPTGSIVDVPLPPGVGPRALAASPDGSLYFTAYSNDGGHARPLGIDRVAPDGTVSVVPLSQPISGPSGMTLGPDGNLWLVAGLPDPDAPPAPPTPARRTIDRVTPAGVVTEFPVVPGVTGAIASGPDGSLWFPELNNGIPTIAKITTSGTVTEYPLPPADAGSVKIENLTAGPDGNVWFTERATRQGVQPQIGRVTPAGVITEFPTTPSSYLGAITPGPDGNLWFTEQVLPDIHGGSANRLATITPAGTITEIPTPTSKGNPGSIAQGTDGTLWFAEIANGMVGRVTYSPPPTVTKILRIDPKHKPTQVILAFSGDLAPASAQDVNNYTISAALPGQGRGPCGCPATCGTTPTPTGPTVGIDAAVYDSVSRTVTLTIHGALSRRGLYQIRVHGSARGGVANNDGVLLSGDGSGKPGSDYVTLIPASGHRPRR